MTAQKNQHFFFFFYLFAIYFREKNKVFVKVGQQRRMISTQGQITVAIVTTNRSRYNCKLKLIFADDNPHQKIKAGKLEQG